MPEEFVMAAAGGAIIGVASVLLLWFNGRIAGISGIMNGAITKGGESAWQWLFVAGLVIGGLMYQAMSGTDLITRTDHPLWLTGIAGALVGFGTRLGSGCTSGHGICGISRLSTRSIIATVLFVAVGMAVATAVFAVTG